MSDKQRLWSEQQEKARVRGDNALKRENLDNVNHLDFTQFFIIALSFVGGY